MVAQRDSSPAELAGALSEEYKLTPNQIDYLGGVVLRAERAKGIIRHLEDKFGIDESGIFQDAEGLHRLVFAERKEPIPRGLEAVSYNIAIAFISPNKASRNNWFMYDQLGVPIEQITSRLKRERKTNCAALTFYTSKLPKPSDGTEDRLNTEAQSACRLRQVFDYILGNKFSRYVWTQADLYARGLVDHIIRTEHPGIVSCIGLNVDRALSGDYVSAMNAIDARINYITGYLSLAPPKEVEISGERRIQTLEARKARLEQDFAECASVLETMPTSELRAISFLFSTIRPSQVPHRLKLVKELYEQCYEQSRSN